MPPTDRPDTFRERMKAKARELAAQRRAKRAADPRVQAMKRALKDKAKLQRQKLRAELKEKRQERAVAEREQRDDALRAFVRPATEKP
jgi:hypothetical protein